jgi:flagellar hook assembly protein FlgD
VQDEQEGTIAVSITPNPFGAATTISFGLQGPARARLVVYNIQGQLVRTLVDGTVPPGTNRVEWDGRNEDGLLVGTGVYLCRLATERGVSTRKMLLLR